MGCDPPELLLESLQDVRGGGVGGVPLTCFGAHLKQKKSADPGVTVDKKTGNG